MEKSNIVETLLTKALTKNHPPHVNRSCFRCSCDFAEGIVRRTGQFNLTWAFFATANLPCFPDFAYVYEAHFLTGIHQQRCQLGPGACETEDTKPYYVDDDIPWSEVNRDERAKWLSLYIGAYGGFCLGLESKCNPVLDLIFKIFQGLGVSLCLTPLIRYYLVTNQLLLAADAQILVFYIRGEARWMFNEAYQIKDTKFVHPDLAKKCSCMDRNVTGLDDKSMMSCSEPCRMKQKNIEAYGGLNMFIQVAFIIISGMDLHWVAKDSPTGQLTFSIFSDSPEIDTCFQPDPSIQCS